MYTPLPRGVHHGAARSVSGSIFLLVNSSITSVRPILQSSTAHRLCQTCQTTQSPRQEETPVACQVVIGPSVLSLCLSLCLSVCRWPRAASAGPWGCTGWRLTLIRAHGGVRPRCQTHTDRASGTVALWHCNCIEVQRGAKNSNAAPLG